MKKKKKVYYLNLNKFTKNILVPLAIVGAISLFIVKVVPWAIEQEMKYKEEHIKEWRIENEKK